MKNTDVFTLKDFHAKRMEPFFGPEDALIGLLDEKGFSLTECPGDNFFSPDGYYMFKDNGADTLMIAHADTVQFPSPPVIKDGILYSSAIDDRLGVYIGVELLEKHGIKSDILITSNEEMCQSTARMFETRKQYNFIYSFDRSGSDIVMYQYFDKTDQFNAVLEEAGFQLGIGSYSCITECSHLKTKGINIGTGVCEFCHSVDASADLSITVSQLNKFRRFFEQYHDTYFPHDARVQFNFDELLLV